MKINDYDSVYILKVCNLYNDFYCLLQNGFICVILYVI